MTRLALTLLLLAGVVGAALLGDRPRPPADFTYIDHQPPFTLDPQRATYEHDLRLVSALFDGLVRWDPYTYEVIPGIAESWSVSDDGLRYEFRLREAAWSNGDPLTSADVVYSWRRALMPDTAADYAESLFHVRGARAFFEGRARRLAEYATLPATQRTEQAARALLEETHGDFAQNVGVFAPDPRTLVVELEAPVPYFLDLCAFPALFPLHPPSVDACDSLAPEAGRLELSHDWTKPPRLISSGAYRLEDWRFKRDLRLVRNERYWDADRVALETIEVRVVEDPATAVLAFQTGGADWLSDVLTAYLPEMLAQPGNNAHGFSRFGAYFWSFNCSPTLTGGRPNPFHDARVRRAFAMAVDKQALVEKVRRVGEEPAHTLIPPGSIAGYDEDRSIGGPRFDVPAARALLAEAGWADRDGDGAPEDESGEPFPTVDLLASTGSYHENIALALGAMFLEGLGVRTRVVQKETKAYRDDLRRLDYMMARGGWFGDYGDPTTFLDIHVTGDGNNLRAYSSEVFDDLMRRAAAETDAERRMALLEEAERLTTEVDLPVLPLWRYRQFPLYDSERVRGISAHPRAIQRLDYLSISPTPGGRTGP